MEKTSEIVEPKKPLQDGEKITVFSINGMAITSKIEATVKGKGGRLGYFGCLKGKRKMRYLFPKSELIVFKGWNLPIKADSDTNMFCGNACFNFIAESPELLKEFILQNNLLEMDSNVKKRINYTDTTSAEYTYTPIFND